MRIASAIREGKHRKAKSLQWLLTHSYFAKLLAIRRVTQNRDSKTPGIDKVIWRTSAQKIRAVAQLYRRGYKTLPLRKIHIPKKGNKQKLRPLSIPPMRCKAMQALHLLALEPIAETIVSNIVGLLDSRLHPLIVLCMSNFELEVKCNKLISIM